jgi:glyoxylase-like metal-dependent hydrolase (beta-lactamase superfamily II)
MAQSVDPTLHQLRVGPLANCIYLLGDPESQRAWVIDPAWDPAGLLRQAEQEGLDVQGVLLTHTHPDHIGGEIYGQHIPGLAELRQIRPLPVLVHEIEAARVRDVAGVPDSDITTFQDGDRLTLGALEIEVLHTPGHSPGSCCFRIGEHLISGDTLFVQGCGRVDLPGSNPEDMFHSLQRLATLPDEVQVYPGHDYGPSLTSTIGAEREQNMYLRVPDLERWRLLMGGA